MLSVDVPAEQVRVRFAETNGRGDPIAGSQRAEHLDDLRHHDIPDDIAEDRHPAETRQPPAPAVELAQQQLPEPALSEKVAQAARAGRVAKVAPVIGGAGTPEVARSSTADPPFFAEEAGAAIAEAEGRATEDVQPAAHAKTAEVVEGEDGDGEVEVYPGNLEYDEEVDLAPRDKSPNVPADLMELYKRSLDAIILDKEQIVDRAKAVEAGLFAERVLQINNAYDQGEEAFWELRSQYVDARAAAKANPGKKDDFDDSPGDSPESEEAPVKGAKYAAQQEAAAQARQARFDEATEDVNELFTSALSYRTETTPGQMGLPTRLRQDLEELAGQTTAARNAMIGSIVRWTFEVSMRYQGQGAAAGMSPLDVLQEGNLGAIHGVEKFDHATGNSLTTYSTWWIRQYITRAIEQQRGATRLPGHVGEKLTKVRRAEDRLTARRQPGDDPVTEADIASAAGIKPDRLEELRRVNQRAARLDDPLDDDGTGATIGDMQEDTDAVQPDDEATRNVSQEQLRGLFAQALDALDDRTAYVLRARHGLDGQGPRKLREIAAELGCTPEWARQLEAKGMRKIREMTVVADQLKGHL